MTTTTPKPAITIRNEFWTEPYAGHGEPWGWQIEALIPVGDDVVSITIPMPNGADTKSDAEIVARQLAVAIYPDCAATLGELTD